MVRPALFPLPVPPLLKSFLYAGFVLAVILPFRRLKWEISFDKTDLIVFFSYLVSFILFNLSHLTEAITNDELAHASRAVHYLYFYFVLPEYLQAVPFLKLTPITELSFYISMVFLGGVILLTVFYQKVVSRQSMWVKGAFLWVVLTLVGFPFQWAPITQEAHPPLRLFPLFLSQAVFGLTDVSFRLPGLVAAAVISFGVYRVVRTKIPSSLPIAIVVGALIYFIPTVFHSAVVVQPSIWAYGVGVGTFLSLYWAYETGHQRYLIMGGVLIALGVLLRQNSLLYWSVFLPFVFFEKEFRKSWVLACFPILFTVPYFLTLAQIGHPMVNVKMMDVEMAKHHYEAIGAFDIVEKALQKTWFSLSSGEGLVSILKSTTIPWMIFFVCGTVVALIGFSHPLRWFYAVLIPGFILFHGMARPWAMGRYQAEYIAPLIVTTILLLIIGLKSKPRRVVIGILVYLSLYSFFMNHTIRHDLHHNEEYHRRISSEKHAPYKQALDFLHSQDTRGKFVVLSRSLTYGPALLLCRGFNSQELLNYKIRQEKFEIFLQQTENLSTRGFREFLLDNDIDYFLLDYGEKYETYLGFPGTRDLIGFIHDQDSGSFLELLPFTRQQTFIGKKGGALDLYGVIRR